MNLLQHGVDRSSLLVAGNESMDTTQIYLHASLELKEKALAKTEPVPRPASTVSSHRPALAFCKPSNNPSEKYEKGRFLKILKESPVCSHNQVLTEK